MSKESNSPKKSKLNISPTVQKLGAVSFFADIASEMLYPITPIFLATTFGASMTSLGIIEGIAESIASLLKTYSGHWSDKIAKRKPFIVIGYLLGAISKPMIGISNSWLQVLFARSLDRTGKGLRSAPRDALISDTTPIQSQGAAFGWHRSMDTLGAAGGPLLTVFFLTENPGFDLRKIYWLALIPGLIAVLIACTIKDSEKNPPTKKEKPQSLRLKDLNPNLLKFFAAWSIFSLVNSSDVFLLMKAKGSGLSLTTIVVMYCAYNLTYAMSSPFLGKLSDSIPRKYLLMLGLFVYALVYLGFSVSTTALHFWLLFLAYGVYMGATDGVGKALVIDHCSPDLKATALGLLGTLSGVATLFASVLAGLLWDHFGAQMPFYLATLGAVIAILILSQIKSSASPS